MARLRKPARPSAPSGLPPMLASRFDPGWTQPEALAQLAAAGWLTAQDLEVLNLDNPAPGNASSATELIRHRGLRRWHTAHDQRDRPQ